MVSWFNMATYGAIGPLWFGKGEGRIAQRAETVEQCGSDDMGSFTQVRAAARRKTLLLLWWIDERTMVKTQRSSPQDRLGTRAATRI